ncbi:hypothetical protein [Rhodopseudomonas sp.]|uniref:hypothetical protein n=1 Tax=Rhodopseudomonas sp. TaxID=1078 RepID=UPI003B3B27A8
MTTLSGALAAIRSAITANVPSHPQTHQPLPIGWLGDDALVLPDVPSPFVYTLFDANRSGVIENGGGRGANRHRSSGVATILVFVPIGAGLQVATDFAEVFAAVFRPFKQGGVTCDAVTVYPGGPGSSISVPGLDSEAANYFWAACDVEFYFDLIG